MWTKKIMTIWSRQIWCRRRKVILWWRMRIKNQMSLRCCQGLLLRTSNATCVILFHRRSLMWRNTSYCYTRTRALYLGFLWKASNGHLKKNDPSQMRIRWKIWSWWFQIISALNPILTQILFVNSAITHQIRIRIFKLTWKGSIMEPSVFCRSQRQLQSLFAISVITPRIKMDIWKGTHCRNILNTSSSVHNVTCLWSQTTWQDTWKRSIERPKNFLAVSATSPPWGCSAWRSTSVVSMAQLDLFVAWNQLEWFANTAQHLSRTWKSTSWENILGCQGFVFSVVLKHHRGTFFIII